MKLTDLSMMNKQLDLAATLATATELLMVSATFTIVDGHLASITGTFQVGNDTIESTKYRDVVPATATSSEYDRLDVVYANYAQFGFRILPVNGDYVVTGLPAMIQVQVYKTANGFDVTPLSATKIRKRAEALEETAEVMPTR